MVILCQKRGRISSMSILRCKPFLKFQPRMTRMSTDICSDFAKPARQRGLGQAGRWRYRHFYWACPSDCSAFCGVNIEFFFSPESRSSCPRVRKVLSSGSIGPNGSEAVVVFHILGSNIGYCFDPAVGMPREPFQVVVGIVGTEIIEKQERIEQCLFTESKNPVQVDSGYFKRWLAIQCLCVFYELQASKYPPESYCIVAFA